MILKNTLKILTLTLMNVKQLTARRFDREPLAFLGLNMAEKNPRRFLVETSCSKLFYVRQSQCQNFKRIFNVKS